MKGKKKSRFSELMDSSMLQAKDYKTYNIKERVDNLIAQSGVSAETLLEEINKLPDVGFIKAMKQTVQLLYENGRLDAHNLVAVTSKENFSDSNSIYHRLRYLNSADLVTQENIDWVLRPHKGKTSAKETTELEILAKNNQLTEKNLQAYKSGEIKDLFSCQLVSSPSRAEEAVLNSKIRDRIYDCGQASATLGFNAFEPSVKISPSLEITNPITHTVIANNNTSALSALLTFAFLLQIFKGANFFPSTFKNTPDPESDPITKIQNNLKEAFKMYRDMDEEMDKVDEKAMLAGLHKSCFFWREKGEEKTQLETATSPKPSR